MSGNVRRRRFFCISSFQTRESLTEMYFRSLALRLRGVSSCIRYAQKALLKSDESANKDDIVMSPELFVVLDLDENRECFFNLTNCIFISKINI